MKEIVLRNTDKKAIIDDEDYERIMSLGLSWGLSNGYVVSTNRHKEWGQVRLHRVVLNCSRFDNTLIDHKDNDPLNCQKENIRFSTRSTNAVNVKRKVVSYGAKYISKYRGVYWQKRQSTWSAQIGYKYRIIHGGTFRSEVEAAKKANELYLKYFGEFGPQNIIDGITKQPNGIKHPEEVENLEHHNYP